MKQIRTILVVLLAFILVNSPVPAEVAGVTVSVDKPTAHVGDQVWVEARVMTRDGEEVSFRHLTAGVSENLVFGKPETDTESLPDGYTLHRFRIPVSPFELGTQILGAVGITVNGEEEIREIPDVNVESVLAKDSQKQDINPLKPQMDIDPDYTHLWKLGGLALAALALLTLLFLGLRKLWYRWREGRKGRVKEEPLLPPYEELRKRISELLAGRYLKDGQVKEFYVELAEIGKRFLGRVFDVAAEVETSQELLDCLDGEMKTDEERQVRDFLDACDMVKFAKVRPGQGEINHHVNLAYQFAQGISTRLRSPDSKNNVSEEKEDQHVPV